MQLSGGPYIHSAAPVPVHLTQIAEWMDVEHLFVLHLSLIVLHIHWHPYLYFLSAPQKSRERARKQQPVLHC